MKNFLKIFLPFEILKIKAIRSQEDIHPEESITINSRQIDTSLFQDGTQLVGKIN